MKHLFYLPLLCLSLAFSQVEIDTLWTFTNCGQTGRYLPSNIQAGYHSIRWDANQYSSGVYFVKMVAGEYVNTQKLMLIK